jgi:arginine utilization protein RocB
MSIVGAFCNQLIRFFEELQGTFPEEKSISMALEAIKAAKKSNPKLTVDIFYRHIYSPANDLIMNRKEDEIIALAQNIMATKFNELTPALMIFDKYWPGMSQSNRDVIWQYLEVLCKLCEKAQGI